MRCSLGIFEGNQERRAKNLETQASDGNGFFSHCNGREEGAGVLVGSELNQEDRAQKHKEEREKNQGI